MHSESKQQNYAENMRNKSHFKSRLKQETIRYDMAMLLCRWARLGCLIASKLTWYKAAWNGIQLITYQFIYIWKPINILINIYEIAIQYKTPVSHCNNLTSQAVVTDFGMYWDKMIVSKSCA